MVLTLLEGSSELPYILQEPGLLQEPSSLMRKWSQQALPLQAGKTIGLLGSI